MSPKTRITFRVHVVDGEGIPVPGLELGARFRYPAEPTTWSRATTDGDGYAAFFDEHPEAPLQACLFMGDERCDTWRDVEDGGCYVLEV